jgi:dUTP pyrophosphatase
VKVSEDFVIRCTQLHSDLPIPNYAHIGDAGADLVSAESITLEPGMRAAVSTGLSVEIPLGYVGLVHPRSGLAIKNGISMVNTPGTIDSGYRGEIKVLLINHDQNVAFQVNRGDRIAQLVIQKVERAHFVQVDSLDETARGAGGFGSTGISS